MATHADESALNQRGALRLHALKNCAATISVLTKLLGKTGSVDRKHLDRLQNTVDRMTVLLCESLDQATELHDVSEILEYVQREAEPKAQANHVQLEFSHSPTLLRGPTHDLGEALLNLVNNAIEATPPGGHVRVLHSANATGTQNFVISDEGPGMSPELARNAGRRRVRSSKRTGSGVGLVLARRVVEDQGGKLDFLPSMQGTTVRVLLPAAA
jgi:signal transduction histidine kinase